MLYDHAHAMQVKLCKANTRGVIEEARLRREVIAQLTATQQRVVELTIVAEEAPNLLSRVDEARWDANKAEKAFEALSARL